MYDIWSKGKGNSIKRLDILIIYLEMDPKNFPIYKELIQKVALKREPNDIEKLAFCKFIASISDQDCMDRIWIIIKLYSLEEKINIPSKVTSVKSDPKLKNISFNFTNFPITLQKILIEFSEIHSKAIRSSK